MVTRSYGTDKDTGVTEYYGLSSDDKPLDGVSNGSKFIEMDTSTLYLFDMENKVWYNWGRN